MSESPELVVLGNLLLDDVVFEDGRTRMAQPGGAVLYFALAAGLFDCDVGVVSLRGRDYPREILTALERRQVRLEGLRDTGEDTLRAWLLYEGEVRRLVHRLEGPTHAEVSPTPGDIPASWLAGARAFHLAPMPYAVQRELLSCLAEARPDAQVSLDPYELLRSPEDLPAWRQLLEEVDLLLLSADEMRLPGEPAQALAPLLAGRLRSIAYKQGAQGGLLLRQGRAPLPWPTRAAEVVDLTGAGDAFAAGYLCGRLQHEPQAAALQRGVVAASFAIEGPGPDGLLTASPQRMADRRLAWEGVPSPPTPLPKGEGSKKGNGQTARNQVLDSPE